MTLKDLFENEGDNIEKFMIILKGRDYTESKTKIIAIKEQLLKNKKGIDNNLLTNIHEEYIEPYLNKIEAEIEEAIIKEQEYNKILNKMENITQNFPKNETDVYAIKSYFMTADKYKEAVNFYKYATVLLNKLRLINEKDVIDGEMKELETLKSVEDNSAFLSRIFNTYIEPHLIYNDYDKKYHFDVSGLSTKIEKLKIERDKEEQQDYDTYYEKYVKPLKNTVRQGQIRVRVHNVIVKAAMRARPINTGRDNNNGLYQAHDPNVIH